MYPLRVKKSPGVSHWVNRSSGPVIVCGMPDAQRPLTALLAMNVAAERVRLRMDQAVLADRLGVDRSTVTRIENGQRPVRVDELLPLCEALGVTLVDLLRGATPGQMTRLGLS